MRTHASSKPRLGATVASISFAAALFFPPGASRADIIYVSYNGQNTIHRFDSVTGADQGVFASAGLNQPSGLALDSAGNLFVANFGANNIMEFTPAGVGSVFASTALPTDLAFDSAGNLYVANFYAGTISKFTSPGVGSTFATGLSFPQSLAVDAGGNVFVANVSDYTIRKFTPSAVGSVFASPPVLSAPGYLTFDQAGNLYCPNDNNSDNIVKFKPNGSSSVFLTGLISPLAVKFDSAGNVFVVNESAGFSPWNTIEKYSPNGSHLAQLASPGFNLPWGIAIQPVPEPSTWALLALGIPALLSLRRPQPGKASN